jgi:hypothetical protein
MSDFADVEQFAREHAACGGLTPSAQSRPGAGGGYLLTITCACGALLDRWVTAEEASQPLPPPSREPAPAPRVSTPAPAPQVTPAPAPRVSTPAPAPTRAIAWPTRPSPPRPPQVAVTVQPARRPSRGRAVWLILALLVALTGGAAVYLTGVPLELAGALDELTGLLSERPAASPAPTAPPPSAPVAVLPAARERAALDEIVTSLRQLQANTTPSVSHNDYASHVAGTRLTVERLVGEVPEPARAPAREVLDVYRLAGAAWRARTLDDREEWERVGRDPAIDLCPAVKRVADAAGAPANASRARGVAVGAALLPLWECAAERTAALGRTPAG